MHLLRWRDISSQVYEAAVTGLSRADVRKLFESLYLDRISRIFLENLVINDEVGHRILGHRTQPTERVMNSNIK